MLVVLIFAMVGKHTASPPKQRWLPDHGEVGKGDYELPRAFWMKKLPCSLFSLFLHGAVAFVCRKVLMKLAELSLQRPKREAGGLQRSASLKAKAAHNRFKLNGKSPGRASRCCRSSYTSRTSLESSMRNSAQN